MNFKAGRFLPPSNNVAAQPSLFQRGDPFARNQPFSVRQALSGGVPGAAPSTVANGATPETAGGGEIPGAFPLGAQVERILESAAGLLPGPTGQRTPTSLDALKLLQSQMEAEQGPPPDPRSPVNPAADILAQDAKAFLAGQANNPFITEEGKASLAAGSVPAFNQVNPAFYRYSSPTVVQALTGLYNQTGLFGPGDIPFFVNLFRPRGL